MGFRQRSTITGGIVKALGKGNETTGIGGGRGATGDNITISGGDVTAKGVWGAGIGGGEKVDNEGIGSNITISGGNVNASSVHGAGIGGGYYCSAENIAITGGNVTVISETASGIGGGESNAEFTTSAKNILITGGTVTAQVGSHSYGIGGDSAERTSNIIISGGSVKGTLGCVPTDGQGHNVYLAELKSQSDINDIKVDENPFKRAGNHLDDSNTYTDGTFYLYLTEDNHRLTGTKDGKSYLALNDKEENSFVIEEVNAGDFRVLDDTGQMATTGYTYDSSSNILKMNKEASNYTIKGFLTTEERIVVAEGFNGAITIDNVDIDVSDVSDVSEAKKRTAFEVFNTAKLTLKLKNTNTLKSGRNRAGLQFCDANNTTSGNLVITSIDGEGETSGNLYAVGGFFGAGIGGFSKQLVNNITIQGGTIEAIAGDCAAAIGGGDFGAANNITITGGIVKALGNEQGSTGIGGGRNGTGENITISGGDVTAKGSLGAGIGGGFKYDKACIGKDITISGGNVNAFSENGAGIGGGFNCLAENITITGGTVTAKGGDTFDIGGSSTENTIGIEISGGSVKGTLGCVPTDGNGHNVYLAKLEDQPDVDEVKVDTGSFKRKGNHIDDEGNYTDNAFYMYLTGNNHTVTSNELKHGARWNGNDGFKWITESSYNLIIPASINLNEENALETSIDNVALVDTTNKVNVKVSNSTDITDGKLNLKRENVQENQISTSLVSFDEDGTDLVNKGSTLFTVGDMETDNKILYFNKPISPSGNLILAGNYIGSINFEVSID